jgi:mannitol-1-phosphate/altronate dehydrogenase
MVVSVFGRLLRHRFKDPHVQDRVSRIADNLPGMKERF